MSEKLLTRKQLGVLEDCLATHAIKRMTMAQIIGALRAWDFPVRRAADVHELRARSIAALKK